MSKVKQFSGFIRPIWLLALAPPLLFPDPIRALALLGLPLLWLLNRWQTGHFIRRTPVDWLIFLLLLTVGIGLYASFSVIASLDKLCGILFHIVIFYAVVETIRHEAGLLRSLCLYFGLALLVVAIGLSSTDWLLKMPILRDITARLPVLLNNLPGAEGGIGPNQLAGTLLWCFPLQLSLLWGLRNRPTLLGVSGQIWWPLLLLTFVLSVLTFALTQSRGGWLGGFAAVIFLFSLYHRYIRRAAALFLGAAFLIASWIGWSRVAEFLVSDTTEAFVGSLTSLGFRQQVWQASLWGIADFPFTGIGLGVFREVVFVLYPITVPPTSPIPHAHNQFMQVALDLGLPGMLVFLALWLSVAYMLFFVLRHASGTLLEVTAQGVAASLFGFFIYGLSDTIALGAKPGFFLWWLFALSVGLYQMTWQAKLDDLSELNLQEKGSTG